MRKREMILLFTAIFAVAAIFFVQLGTSSIETGSWGLSFRQEGAAPIGNASIQELKKYGAAYIGDTSEKVIYLTFDAGYENGCTEKILDVLEKHGVFSGGQLY